jgi:outer membrane protein OmpA-like peptidoglycan-associated protein
VVTEGSFVFRAPFAEFVVQRVGRAVQVTPETLELARRVVQELRLALQVGDPLAKQAARALAELFAGAGTVFGSSEADPSSSAEPAIRALLERFDDELREGRLKVELRSFDPIRERDEPPQELLPLPPRRPESNTQTFEVRFVDEVGQAISGVRAEFNAGGIQERATNPAGVALLDNVPFTSASVSVQDVEGLSKVLDPRWEKPRPGAPPKEANTHEVTFRGESLGPFGLKAAQPNTVVVKPPLGKLFVELFDKTGRVRHANRPFTITGPQSFEATTDDEGRFLQPDVFPGNYELRLTLVAFEGDEDSVTDEVTTPIVALNPEVSAPQVRFIGAVPRSILARLHFFFNTNKTFLLPTALPGVRRLRRMYLDYSPCQLLVVGHADTRGSTSYNDELALARARATIAYLKDDVEAWFAFYSHSDPKQRWGRVEDLLMIRSLPDFKTKGSKEDPVSWFQRTRELKLDGKAGTETRHALIEEYMSLDGVSLSEFGQVEAIAHGCGEHFPLDDTGDGLDATPDDEKRDPIDRRVELYFFDAEFGISPKPAAEKSAAKSEQYPTWRRRVARIVDLHPDDPESAKVHFVELADAHFRTNSAVVLPEGENPDQRGEHEALTSMGLIAVAIRFAKLHPERKLLVAGHTDTTADVAFNQKLSNERAEVSFTMLKGGDARRERFKTLCDERHTVADIKQILSWAAGALGFSCNPGKIDDNEGDLAPFVKGFQNSYNDQRETIAKDRDPLDPDGDFGPLTWGAVFDCYEFNLRQELGKDAANLDEIREKLVFVDEEKPFLGFSEHFPIEELGVDHFRSQLNRRVEILFFEPGEEPDITIAASDPDLSELYLPGGYLRTPLGPDDLLLGDIHMILVDDITLEPLVDTAFTIEGEGLKFSGKTDADGRLRQPEVPVGEYTLAVEGRAETATAVVLTHSAERAQIRALAAKVERKFEFRVHDAARIPLAGAQVRVTLPEAVLSKTADGDGLAIFDLPPICPASVLVEWTDGTTQFRQEVFLECNEGDPDALAPCRLENLGYPAFSDLELAVIKFQLDYQLTPLEAPGPNQEMPAQVLAQLKAIWEDKACDARFPGAA